MITGKNKLWTATIRITMHPMGVFDTPESFELRYNVMATSRTEARELILQRASAFFDHVDDFESLEITDLDTIDYDTSS